MTRRGPLGSVRALQGGYGGEAVAATIAAYVAATAAVVGAGISTYSAIEQANQQQELAKSEKQAREIEAQAALDTAAFEEKQHRRRIALLRGEQQAAYAAAGYDTTSGTPLVQDIDLAQQGELEALAIKRAGRMAANVGQYEASIAGWRGENASRAVPIIIAGGAVQAGAGAASSYSSYSYYSKTSSSRRARSVTSDWVGNS